MQFPFDYFPSSLLMGSRDRLDPAVRLQVVRKGNNNDVPPPPPDFSSF